jgi:F-type H+-transporting ATPase subunit gamma
VAKLRDIKRRIKSVKNTAKITHTMELVATAKAKVSQNRIQRAIPYFSALAEIAGEARKAGGGGGRGGGGAGGPPSSAGTGPLHALLVEREQIKKVTLLVVGANRGLCGGYNGNVLRLARRRRDELVAEGKEVSILAVGKKIVNGLRFQQIPFEPIQGPVPDDRPPFADCERIADQLVARFRDEKADRVEAVYTHYYSAGRQGAVVEQILPIQAKDEEAEEKEQASLGVAVKDVEGGPAGRKRGKKASVEFIIEPDPRAILDAIFPLQVKLHVYRVFLEAAASEQIARRVAMKNASDNADEVGRALRMQYNRARQAGITKEILEIVGGAAALE